MSLATNCPSRDRPLDESESPGSERSRRGLQTQDQGPLQITQRLEPGGGIGPHPCYIALDPHDLAVIRESFPRNRRPESLEDRKSVGLGRGKKTGKGGSGHSSAGLVHRKSTVRLLRSPATSTLLSFTEDGAVSSRHIVPNIIFSSNRKREARHHPCRSIHPKHHSEGKKTHETEESAVAARFRRLPADRS